MTSKIILKLKFVLTIVIQDNVLMEILAVMLMVNKIFIALKNQVFMILLVFMIHKVIMILMIIMMIKKLVD